MAARRRIVLMSVVATFGLLLGVGDAFAQTSSEATEGEGRIVNDPLAALPDDLPKRAMFTSEKAIEKLRAAYAVALERVIEIPACGELFAELETNGVEMLTTTFYTPAHPFDEQSLCRTAAAFTWVGGVHTRLCRRFSSLSEERAAMTLIHEALHHAGLTEKPTDPNGMSAREIDAMVEEACGRKSLQRELSARLER